MLICHCKQIRDGEIRALVHSGASTNRAVELACGAGADCGGCRVSIERILAEERRAEVRARHEPAQVSLPVAIATNG